MMNMRLADLTVRHMVLLVLIAGFIAASVFTVRAISASKRAQACLVSYGPPSPREKACEKGTLNP